MLIRTPIVTVVGRFSSWLLEQESQEHEHEPDRRADRATLGLAAEDLHRDRGTGRGVVPKAAAPGRVARFIRLLLLEHLVAIPGTLRLAVADRDQDNAEQPQHDVEDAHSPLPFSRRSRTAD